MDDKGKTTIRTLLCLHNIIILNFICNEQKRPLHVRSWIKRSLLVRFYTLDKKACYNQQER